MKHYIDVGIGVIDADYRVNVGLVFYNQWDDSFLSPSYGPDFEFLCALTVLNPLPGKARSRFIILNPNRLVSKLFFDQWA